MRTDAVSDFAAPRPHTEPGTGTGGPKDRKHLMEQVLGWTLTVVVAMLIVQLHLM
ncbi:SCO1431 family membrane protein [Streptomyces sp. CBMA29]|uniref:SCO1431 family membrane protein n=1 Tax=Streptomyces sp. CBMA29 TaxID=1896314 RepID=UPI001661C6A7|nr:SCO1431 family membrane protein [Streptomyces sp. CBMA29]